MRKSINEAETRPQEQVQSQNINDLTVAEAKRLGYKLLGPEQQAQLADIVRKEKSNRAIEKEFENTIFESEDSNLPIKEAS